MSSDQDSRGRDGLSLTQSIRLSAFRWQKGAKDEILLVFLSHYDHSCDGLRI
jgi:hypothetical protein